MKSLKSRGQSGNVNVGLPKDVLPQYVDGDDIFVFGDHMLAETKFRPKNDLSGEVSDLIQSLTSINNKEESVKSILKHFLIEKFPAKNKSVESVVSEF